MFLSAIANAWMILIFLEGKTPGTEEYIKAIGRQNWVGFLVIGVPMMAALMLLMFWMLGRIQKLTGLDRADLMSPGQTVRRNVGE
jgi:hypothetical protein